MANAPDLEKIRAQFWPHTTDDRITFKLVPHKEATEFLRANFDAVFPNRGEAMPFVPSPERRESLQSMVELYQHGHLDTFLFYDSNGAPIGWTLAEAEDSITYYLRNTGLLPAYQKQGIYLKFAAHHEKYLAAIGYERITSHHQTTNRRVIIGQLRNGFLISGMELTERWGPLVKMVKFLKEDRRDAYYKTFGLLSHLE
jgi:GNAT superfamily N-acetyltransferase